MRRPTEIWGRRAVALGLGLIALAALGGGLLLAGGDDDDGDGVVARAVGAGGRRGEADRRRSPTRQAGIAARIPAGWKQERDERSKLIALESGDRCVLIRLTAPVPANQAGTLFDDSLARLRDDLEGEKVSRLSGQRVSGLPGDKRVARGQGSRRGSRQGADHRRAGRAIRLPDPGRCARSRVRGAGRFPAGPQLGRVQRSSQSASTTVATPCPTPTQRVAIP